MVKVKIIQRIFPMVAIQHGCLPLFYSLTHRHHGTLLIDQPRPCILVARYPPIIALLLRRWDQSMVAPFAVPRVFTL